MYGEVTRYAKKLYIRHEALLCVAVSNVLTPRVVNNRQLLDQRKQDVSTPLG